MGLRRVYIESGITENGHVILEEFTNDVLILTNLLKDVTAGASTDFIRHCNSEGDHVQALIIVALPDAAHAAPKLSYKGPSDFVIQEPLPDEDFDEEEDGEAEPNAEDEGC